MTKLTVARIKKIIANDKRIDPNIDLDEYGKAIVYTADDWTWDAQDGNRGTEGFLISEDNCDNDPQDTVAYFRERLKAVVANQ